MAQSRRCDVRPRTDGAWPFSPLPPPRPTRTVGRLRGYAAGIAAMPPGVAVGCAAVGVLAGIMAAGAPLLIAFVIPGFVCTYALVRLVLTCTPADAKRDRTRLLALTLLVLVGHVGLGLGIYSSPSLMALSPDAYAYHRVATEVAESWQRGTTDVQLRLNGKEGFTYALSALYWLFGPHAISALVLNATLAAALLPLVYDTTRRLFGVESARVAIILPAVLPGFVVWSSQLLREASVVFFLAVVANAAVRLTRRIEIVSICVLGGSVVALFTLRPNVALVVLGGAVAGLSLGLRASKGLLVGSAMIALIVGVMVVAGVGQSGLSSVLAVDLEQADYLRQALGRDAGSSVDAYADISSPLAALAFLPSAVVSFLLGPFPWQIRNSIQLGGLVDACAFWVLLPSLYRGLRHGVRVTGRRIWPLLVPAALLLMMLSLLISNYGMIVRQRPQVLIFLLPVVAHGWAIRRRRAHGGSGAAGANDPESVAAPNASPPARAPDGAPVGA